MKSSVSGIIKTVKQSSSRKESWSQDQPAQNTLSKGQFGANWNSLFSKRSVLISYRCSPLHFMRVQKIILSLYDLLELETESKQLKRFHTLLLSTLRVFFLYCGGLCQSFALLLSSSLEETIAIMALNFSYINAQVKGTVFLVRKQKIGLLWQRLGDSDFHTKNPREIK